MKYVAAAIFFIVVGIIAYYEGKRSARKKSRPTGSTDVDQIVDQLKPWIDKHQRTAWLPIVHDEGHGARAGSQFGGLPWLLPDEHWPLCGACGRDMHLFLQLNSAELPTEFTNKIGEGLLQLFYCIRTDCERNDWEPFDSSHLVRVISADTSRPAQSSSDDMDPFPAKRITGWQPVDDLPHPEDHPLLGLDFKYDFKAGTVDIACSPFGLTFRGLPISDVNDDDLEIAEAIGKCLTGDKLSGWPSWVQGSEYPSCPKCGIRMEYVFQVDSEDNIPFMFGDCGCGHITQCPEHPDVFGFGWACC